MVVDIFCCERLVKMMVASKEEMADLAANVEDVVHIIHELARRLETVIEENAVLKNKVDSLENELLRQEEYMVARFQGLVNKANS
jgi:hypothetical protein